MAHQHGQCITSTVICTAAWASSITCISRLCTMWSVLCCRLPPHHQQGFKIDCTTVPVKLSDTWAWTASLLTLLAFCLFKGWPPIGHTAAHVWYEPFPTAANIQSDHDALRHMWSNQLRCAQFHLCHCCSATSLHYMSSGTTMSLS